MAESFNLVNEPWIRVRDSECRIQMLSLREVLVNAHRFAELAGESPAQDAAMLRLLIAVVYTVFYRVDENGVPAVLEDEDDALDRWEEIWKRKAFPSEPICAYLKEWEHRLDLLDKDRPFYQVPEAAIPAELRREKRNAAKLNGNVLQSDNTSRIFSGQTQETYSSLSFSEAARWLLYLHAYDDVSISPKFRKNIGIGWLGGLGFICADGNNLFETILLNTSFLNWKNELYSEPRPTWERPLRTGDRSAHIVPNNIPELFTLQSRRICLTKQEDRVDGYYSCGGDVLSAKDAFPETMTIWTKLKKEPGHVPRKISASKYLWRDFSTLIGAGEEAAPPGITVWLTILQNNNLIEKSRLIRFSTVGVFYDKNKSSVTNTVSDTLSFHADLLSDAGRDWQTRIEAQVQLCDRLASAVGTLAGELSVAAGKRETENKKLVPPPRMKVAEAAKAQFYFRIDASFRDWLLKPHAGQSINEVKALVEEWHETAGRIARDYGRELVDDAGEPAFLGRWVEIEKDRKQHYSSPEAFNCFLGKLKNI